jgi:hypothetical protein
MPHGRIIHGLIVDFKIPERVLWEIDAKTRNGWQGRLADHLTRMDLIVLDELGYLPFAQAGGELLSMANSQFLAQTDRPGQSGQGGAMLRPAGTGRAASVARIERLRNPV